MNLFKCKPIIQPTINARSGTMDECFTQGYVLQHSNPFGIHGIFLKEEGCGGLAQEIQEVALIQNQIVWWTPLAFAVSLALSLVACYFGHLALAWSLIPALVLTFGIYQFLINVQYAASEEQSHALSVQAGIVADGMTLERSEQCFLSNLGGYQYNRPVTAENARKYYPDALAWIAANGPLIEELKARKASMYEAGGQT